MLNKFKQALSQHESYMSETWETSQITLLSFFTLLLGAAFGVEGELLITRKNAIILGLQVMIIVLGIIIAFRFTTYLGDKLTGVKPSYLASTMMTDMLLALMMGISTAAGFFASNEFNNDIITNWQMMNNLPLALFGTFGGFIFAIYLLVLFGELIIMVFASVMDEPSPKKNYPVELIKTESA